MYRLCARSAPALQAAADVLPWSEARQSCLRQQSSGPVPSPGYAAVCWTTKLIGECWFCVAWGLVFLLLLQNNPERAKQEFEMAARKKHNQRKNHAPLLAQAAVAFNSGNLARAHQL